MRLCLPFVVSLGLAGWPVKFQEGYGLRTANGLESGDTPSEDDPWATIPGLRSVGYMTQWGEGLSSLSTPWDVRRAGVGEQPVLPRPFLTLFPLAPRVDATSADPDYKPGEVLWGKQRIFLF